MTTADATHAGPKLSLLTKLSYGFGAVAVGVRDNGLSYFLLLFYSQVIGLDELVGLDGHRMHIARVRGFSNSPPIILSGSAIATLLRILPKTGEVAASRSGDLVRFQVQHGDVRWELETPARSAVEFPPYSNVIPREGSESFRTELEREALVRGLGRMPKSRRGGLRMVVNGAITLEKDSDEGTATCTIPVLDSTHSGPDTTIGVNPAYLTDALSCDVPIVIGRFSGELDPIRLDLGPDKVAVVMPMRL